MSRDSSVSSPDVPFIFVSHRSVFGFMKEESMQDISGLNLNAMVLYNLRPLPWRCLWRTRLDYVKVNLISTGLAATPKPEEDRTEQPSTTAASWS
ncbi:hypothetical protein HHUSO_G25057 [Huso huso]|uniref:Uncharacterized protein n=1 Tax=Huso huso TaxID=61971 RepID=A0ABR0YSW0_HUSHU